MSHNILSNGSSTNYKYDDDNRMIELSNKSAGDFSQVRTYTHDEVGNITTVTENGETITYTYDALYRLEGVHYSVRDNLDVHYTYDLVGNRTNKDTQTDNFEYIYNIDNRLIEVRQNGAILNTFDYDENGSTIAKRDSAGIALLSFTYDQKRRVSSITTQTETIQYQYDPNDFRIFQTGKNYLLEGEHLEAVYDDAGDIRGKFLRGAIIDEVVNGYLYDESGDKTNYTFHHDNLRSVTGLSGHDGTTLETTEYGPFGNEVGSTGTSDNPLKYTGREQDTTGLYYYRARYYDPEIGRFLTEDPKGFDAGVNFYAYVQNNPTNANDPMGLIKWSAVGKGSAAIIGGGATAVFGAFASTTGAGAVLGVPAVLGGSATLGWGVNEFIAGWLDADIGNVPVPSIPATASLACGSSVERAQEVDLIFSSITAGANIGSWAGKLGPVSDIELSGAAVDLINLGVSTVSVSSNNTSSAGGFVLYPNKQNTNMMHSVYSK